MALYITDSFLRQLSYENDVVFWVTLMRTWGMLVVRWSPLVLTSRVISFCSTSISVTMLWSISQSCSTPHSHTYSTYHSEAHGTISTHWPHFVTISQILQLLHCWGGPPKPLWPQFGLYFSSSPNPTRKKRVAQFKTELVEGTEGGETFWLYQTGWGFMPANRYSILWSHLVTLTLCCPLSPPRSGASQTFSSSSEASLGYETQAGTL